MMLFHGHGELPRLQPNSEMIRLMVERRRVANGQSRPKFQEIPETLYVRVVHDLSCVFALPWDCGLSTVSATTCRATPRRWPAPGWREPSTPRSRRPPPGAGPRSAPPSPATAAAQASG